MAYFQESSLRSPHKESLWPHTFKDLVRKQGLEIVKNDQMPYGFTFNTAITQTWCTIDGSLLGTTQNIYPFYIVGTNDTNSFVIGISYSNIDGAL